MASKLSKTAAAFRQLGFDVTGNSAIRSEWWFPIGSPLWPLRYL